MLANFCFLCGVVLSFRFKTAILIPATLLVWVLALVGGLLARSSGGAIALDFAITTVALQLGYLIGTVSIAGLVALRRSRQRAFAAKRPIVAR